MNEIIFTDAYLGELFTNEALNGNYWWCDETNTWLRWTGIVWVPFTYDEMKELARQWVIQHHTKANAAITNAARSHNENIKRQVPDLVKERNQWERYTFINQYSHLVSVAHGMLVKSIKEFDADPNLFNCQNGVIDLRTGNLIEHDPSQLFLKVAPTNYVPGYHHADWDTALQCIPDDETRDWLQLRLGQSLFGNVTPDAVVLFCQGNGANGKSTIMEGCQYTIGDYYHLLSRRALLSSDDAVPTEIANLEGKRMAFLNELPEGHAISTTKIKELAGELTISARHIRQKGRSFQTTHSLFVNTNYEPVIAESDGGTWRRMVMVKFPYRFCDNIEGPNDRIGDSELKPRINAGADKQHEAILAWLVEGAVKYYANGEAFKHIPAKVKADTLRWRKTCDLLMDYFDQRIRFDPKRAITKESLANDFNYWLDSNHYSPWATRTLTTRIRGHEVTTSHNVKEDTLHDNQYEMLSLREGSKVPDAKTVRVWKGMAFRIEAKEYAPGVQNFNPEHPWDNGPDERKWS